MLRQEPHIVKVGLHGHTHPTGALSSLHPSLSLQYSDSIGGQAGEDLVNNCFVVVLVQKEEWGGQTEGFFKRHFKRVFVQVSHRFFG